MTARPRIAGAALLMGPWPALAEIDPRTASRLRLALAVSALLHALLIWGVGIKAPDFKPVEEPMRMEVVLVNARTKDAPSKADVLAQANLAGGGNTDENRRAKNAMPVLPKDSKRTVPSPNPTPEPVREVEKAEQKVEELERQARELLSQAKPTPATVEAPPAEKPEAPAEKARPGASELLARGMEIARLEAQIARNVDIYQKRPRRKFVGANAREVRFARYVEDWRLKVERVGNLNYPEAARREKLYGSLRLTVSIRYDGTVENIAVDGPSGHRVLDQAAIRIVELAAPYPPFPDDIRKDTDILHITRTWTFTHSDQLVSE